MRARRGVALPITLMVLILLMLLTVGGGHTAIGVIRRGYDVRATTEASAAADAAAYAVWRDWSLLGMDTLAVGDSAVSRRTASGMATALARAVRLTSDVWWIIGTGFVPDTTGARSSRRDVHLLLRKDTPELPVDAVLSVADSVRVTGSGLVDGADTTSATWGAGCVSWSGAGIAAPDTTAVSHGQVLGAPPLIEDPRAGLVPLAGLTAWGAMRASATIRLAAGTVLTPTPAVAGGTCDRLQQTNWGEPLGIGPCHQYAPVVHVAGDLEIRGGRGQGVVFADGDVRVSGGAQFHGVVIAGDDLLTGTGGGDIVGAVIALDARRGSADQTHIGDALRVRRSRCLVEGILTRVAPAVAVRQRSWAELP